jgi:Ca2+-binding EF-hand superfamily protein
MEVTMKFLKYLTISFFTLMVSTSFVFADASPTLDVDEDGSVTNEDIEIIYRASIFRDFSVSLPASVFMPENYNPPIPVESIVTNANALLDHGYDVDENGESNFDDLLLIFRNIILTYNSHFNQLENLIPDSMTGYIHTAPEVIEANIKAISVGRRKSTLDIDEDGAVTYEDLSIIVSAQNYLDFDFSPSEVYEYVSLPENYNPAIQKERIIANALYMIKRGYDVDNSGESDFTDLILIYRNVLLTYNSHFHQLDKLIPDNLRGYVLAAPEVIEANINAISVGRRRASLDVDEDGLVTKEDIYIVYRAWLYSMYGFLIHDLNPDIFLSDDYTAPIHEGRIKANAIYMLDRGFDVDGNGKSDFSDLILIFRNQVMGHNSENDQLGQLIPSNLSFDISAEAIESNNLPLLP